jgi:hypothetical protein
MGTGMANVAAAVESLSVTNLSSPAKAGDTMKLDRRVVVTAVGITQILTWGSTFTFCCGQAPA